MAAHGVNRGRNRKGCTRSVHCYVHESNMNLGQPQRIDINDR